MIELMRRMRIGKIRIRRVYCGAGQQNIARFGHCFNNRYKAARSPLSCDAPHPRASRVDSPTMFSLY